MNGKTSSIGLILTYVLKHYGAHA